MTVPDTQEKEDEVRKLRQERLVLLEKLCSRVAERPWNDYGVQTRTLLLELRSNEKNLEQLY